MLLPDARCSQLPIGHEIKMTKKQRFGDVLREKRIAKKFSLRKFAELVGISPTYLSQVEQSNMDPPTAERVQRMAELLEENPDELIALAGRVADDLPAIIQAKTEVPDLLRAVRGLSAEQLRKLRESAEEMKRDKSKKDK
jgi:transcriptional regulator with XRE-family HTH domain